MNADTETFTDSFGYPGLIAALRNSKTIHHDLLEVLSSAPPSDDAVREALGRSYQPAKQTSAHGLVTGYYIPTIRGRQSQDEQFSTPIYGLPLTNDVRNLTRAALEESVFSAEQAPILAWTDDPIGLFFLQIQGSGCLVLPDSTRLHLRYAGNNGHPYQSIGSALIESGVLPREGLSLDLLKGYLHSDLSRAQKVMQLNPRYIFFTLDREPIIGTHGSELVPFRSVAADPEIYPAHSLLLIKAPIALSENSRAETLEDDAMFLALCHDTGTAIKGPDRLDLFCGDDHRAEVMAGSLRAPATIWRFDRK